MAGAYRSARRGILRLAGASGTRRVALELQIPYDVVEAFFAASASVAVAMFSRDGELTQANRRFLSLLPGGCGLGDLLPDLVVENQRGEMARLLEGRDEGPTTRNLHLQRGDDLPVTLQATWVRAHGDLILIGEAPVADLEASQAVLARLNQRVMELARENAKKSAELERALAELREEHASLEEARRQIEELSRRDALTGLANRRWLEESLRGEIERVARHPAPLSVILVDLDHFKDVNDTYGHGVGDEVLKAAAGCLRDAARTTDLVARYGGEEFLLVLPSTDTDQACVLAERLRARLREMDLGFRPEPVTGSFGIAEWRAGDTLDSFVTRADDALYAAKRGGRDRVETA